MAIVNGQQISDSDFIATPSGASDSGKVAKLNASGVIHSGFIKGFGGTGADGALTVSSGTTTLDLANARFYIKNYTSISITGTGKVAFINPRANGSTIMFRSRGNVTLTSSQTPMIDVSGLGTPGGGGTSVSGSGSSTNSGGSGTNGQSYADFDTIAGAGAISFNAGVDGVVPSSYSFHAYLSDNSLPLSTLLPFERYGRRLWTGTGAGGGSSYNNSGSTHPHTAGTGGTGGGSLIIECAGAWNFTTANGISVAGTNGTAATGDVGGTNHGAGGGGGGAAGFFLAVYETLTANTGTVTTTGGSPGASSAGTGNFNRGGGGGNGVNAGSGGTGATGLATVMANAEFA